MLIETMPNILFLQCITVAKLPEFLQNSYRTPTELLAQFFCRLLTQLVLWFEIVVLNGLPSKETLSHLKDYTHRPRSHFFPQAYFRVILLLICLLSKFKWNDIQSWKPFVELRNLSMIYQESLFCG